MDEPTLVPSPHFRRPTKPMPRPAPMPREIREAEVKCLAYRQTRDTSQTAIGRARRAAARQRRASYLQLAFEFIARPTHSGGYASFDMR